MRMPFRRKKSVPQRALRSAAKAAGMLRLAMRKRALRPRLAHHKGGKQTVREARGS
jgi:hypothetical protein